MLLYKAQNGKSFNFIYKEHIHKLLLYLANIYQIFIIIQQYIFRSQHIRGGMSVDEFVFS